MCYGGFGLEYQNEHASKQTFSGGANPRAALTEAEPACHWTADDHVSTDKNDA